MTKTFNSSGIKISSENIPDLNKRCTGGNCKVCDYFDKELDRNRNLRNDKSRPGGKPMTSGELQESTANSSALLKLWNNHIRWDEPCTGEGCNTCKYISKENKKVPESAKHQNSREPKISFFPMNFGVPRIVPDESHPTGIIGEDPHSHYTETTSFVTDNPLHSCERCMPTCRRCGTRDTAARIKDGEHIPEYQSECRRRERGLGSIPLYN